MTTVNVNFSFDANGTRQLSASQISGLNVMTAGSGSLPVVTLVSPALGTISQLTPIIIDVTDAEALKEVIITARSPFAGRNEVVFDGAFDAQFSGSTRVAIARGYRFTLQRVGGWLPGKVDLKVRAFDTDGNEV